MKRKIDKTQNNVADRLPAILRMLLKDEAIGGKLILLASLLALLVANSSLGQGYEDFWSQNLNIFGISLDLREWVNEFLMAIFFLVVGLEIKRELVVGQLRHFKTALLPIGAAIGGMIVPAAIFLSFNHSQPANIDGWAIPIATDIAFALGVMSLLGNRIPSSLRLFLLTLAIVDDLGSIVIIALFYGEGVTILPLISAAFIVLSLIVCRKFLTLPIFIGLGILLWAAVYKAGIQPSIAGALLGFLAPLKPSKNSIAERLEALAIPTSTYVVVPLFAFANLGLVISAQSWSGASTASLVWGIILGLVIGKVVGVTAASWLLVKLKLAELPANTNWSQIVGVGLLAGIGFTVAVFITELAFAGNEQLINAAKLAILVASMISAVSGYVFLRHREKITRAVH